MFRLNPAPTFWMRVAVPVAGQKKAGTLELECKYRGRAALNEFRESLETRTDLDAVAEVVCGWRDIDAEYSRDNLERLLDQYPGAALAILSTYFREYVAEREKN